MPRPLRLIAKAALIAGSVAAMAGGGATASGHAAATPCGPASATTIADDATARVYATGASAYGCVVGGSRAYRLGATGNARGAAHIEAVRVAGRIAAYGLGSTGVDTGHVTINVRALGPGTLLAQRPATTQVGIEGFQTVDALVLKPDGAIAWIATARSIGKPTFVRQLLRLDQQGLRVLDTGPSLDAASLALHGSTITWNYGTTRRTATLR
jgi:hypothetical protein